MTKVINYQAFYPKELKIIEIDDGENQVTIRLKSRSKNVQEYSHMVSRSTIFNHLWNRQAL